MRIISSYIESTIIHLQYQSLVAFLMFGIGEAMHEYYDA